MHCTRHVLAHHARGDPSNESSLIILKKKKKKETAIKPEELNFSSTRQARGCDHAKFTVSFNLLAIK